MTNEDIVFHSILTT